MSIILPKYGLTVPSETTRFRDLGKELRELGVSVNDALESFDYNGADPGLFGSRLAALEGRATTLEIEYDALEAKLTGMKTQVGLATNISYLLTAAWADVPGLSFTVPNVAGRKLLLTISGGITNGNSGSDKMAGVRFVGGATPATATSVIGRNDEALRVPYISGTSVEWAVSRAEMTIPITGAYTVKVQAKASAVSSLVSKLSFGVELA